MKTLKVWMSVVIATASLTLQGQSINWMSIKPEQKHIANLNAGWDYAATVGIGYGYVIKNKLPGIINAQFSIPAGKTWVDDLKATLGYQARVFTYKGFVATVVATANFRRYESSFARINSFGSEFAAVAGYYRPKWFAAVQFGFDKAIATHIANGEAYKQNFPAAKDGWYVPTGGNFLYGIQGGVSIKNMDVYIKLGKTVDQTFHSSALIPFYFQLGLNKRF